MSARIWIAAFSLLGVVIACIYWPISQPQPLATHYVKLDAQGQALAQWQGPFHCVLDERTQLIWEVKRDDEGHHDAYWSYSWFVEGVGVADGGDCFVADGSCDVSDLVNRANQSGLCGYHDWRLPSAEELHSIIQLAPVPGDPLVDIGFFPRTHKGDYWTSEGGQKLEGFFAYLGVGAMAVNFQTGKTTVLPYRNAAFARLVRGSSSL